ncbi:filamentous haemagglutinin family protein [Pigmentiphaga soli]|uniref:filamentous haemagglutinin family protein n=1 Tax=Pigmentiphaga soli TaxID=1007095 RepID=UPI0031EA0467
MSAPLLSSFRPFARRRAVRFSGSAFRPAFRPTPVASAIAALVLAGAAPSAHAQRAFSSGWFSGKGAVHNTATQTGRLPNGTPASLLTNPGQQSAAARQTLQTSINNLNLAARAIAAQQAAQAEAHAKALANGDDGVPDGLADGGLKVDTGSLTAGWLNAKPLDNSSQKVIDGRTVVTVGQMADKAILNWETFNVGRNTTVDFDQATYAADGTRTAQTGWAVLNRVNDPRMRPSQILGQIHADGTVLIANRNGIVFGGSSQVDTRNLVAAAAAIADEQFADRGIYSLQASGSYQPSFTDASGKLLVEAGAQIRTAAPGSVTQGGGYALLLGAEVENAGTITTPKGQSQLAAGDFFIVRPGQGTDANQTSTTRGNEVVAGADAAAAHADGVAAGRVANRGLLQSSEGDITLTGHEVVQDGVALSTTTVNNRGTIHLSTPVSDTAGTVTIKANALNAILLQDDGSTALDSQRQTLIRDSAGNDQARRTASQDVFDNLSKLDDRADLSRVEIVAGGAVDFAGGSATVATGGQVAVSAGNGTGAGAGADSGNAAAIGRTTVSDGATIDVSGAVGVAVAMSSNNVEINVQGNEQRDAPLNRDTKNLNNSDVWVDRRTLIHVPAGTGGYTSDRWYTAGGLLEVGGYLDLSGHSIGEWAAQGGSVAFAGNAVDTLAGSRINLSGGTLDVQTGYINQSWMKGTDGRLYELGNARADVAYAGLYKGFEDTHARWGDSATSYFYSPLIGKTRRLENGYTVGRDAGRLIVSTREADLSGDVVADTYQGPRQVQKADASLDGYNQSQTAAARGAALILGAYQTAYNTDADIGPTGVFHNLTPTVASIVFGPPAIVGAAAGDAGAAGPGGDAAAAGGDGPATADVSVLYLDSDYLSGLGLGSILAAGSESVEVDGAMAVMPGGTIALHAPRVSVRAGLTAHGGSIALGNVLAQTASTGKTIDTALFAADGSAAVTVDGGAVLDASGLWSNFALDADDGHALPFMDGGSVDIRSAGFVAIGADTTIDVSSGAAMRSDGAVDGGSGGDVTVAAGYVASETDGQRDGVLALDGALRGYGVKGGGTLRLESGSAIDIGNGAGSPLGSGDGNGNGQASADSEAGADASPGSVALSPFLFKTGFAGYTVSAHGGIAVGDGVDVAVVMPVLRPDLAAAHTVPTGSDPTAILQVWTPPLYQEDPKNSVLTQRAGASLALSSGSRFAAGLAPMTIGHGASIRVDPGQSIDLHSDGQMTIDGRLDAWGGAIRLAAMPENPDGQHYTPALSVWIGSQAVLDAAARAYVARDAQGRRYGVVPAGGSIIVAPSDGSVIVRPGALLDASGSAAMVDSLAGGGAADPGQPITLVSDGGIIELHSNSGIVLDGTLRAAAGGDAALGGSLALYLDGRSYVQTRDDIDESMNRLRQVTLVQQARPSGLAAALQPGQADDALVFGQAMAGVDQIAAGGFSSLTLSAPDGIRFEGDVDLALAGSVNLKGGLLTVADDTPDAQARIDASYIRLDGGAWGGPGGNPDSFAPGLFSVFPGQAPRGASALTLSAGLIDIHGKVLSGAYAIQGTGLFGGGYVALDGFADLILASRGDVRLGDGGLAVPGRLEVDAAQVYPASSSHGALMAGMRVVAGAPGSAPVRAMVDPDSELIIRSSTGTVPDVPYSAFGNLVLVGGTVDQGGVVRAPLGTIALNTTGGSLGTDWTNDVVVFFAVPADPVVILRSGSLTSVSAAGLDMPFGGTVDGVTYDGVGTVGRETTKYNLADTFVTRGDNSGVKVADNNVLVTGVSIGAAQLIGEPGAVVDLSGGGTLQGEGFVSGRGGSVNVLAAPLYDANPAANTYSRPDNQVYAILPGYASGYAPLLRDNDKGAGDPSVGRQITVGDGVPGLPAGTYTLLPASFALMPGAFRVELGGTAAPGQASYVAPIPNGSWATTAVQGTAGTGRRDALATQVILTPGSVVRNYAQYNETTFTQFLLAQAEQFGTVHARLPEDGKLLDLEFGASDAVADPLDFAGTVRFGGAVTSEVTGIDGAMIVGSGAPIEIRPADTAPAEGMVSLTDAALDAFGASSLSIGGAWRYFDGNSTLGDSARLYFGSEGQSHNGVTVRDGAVLKAGQVFLVGNTLTVEGGATIDTRGFGGNVIDSTLGYAYANGLKASPNGSEPAVLAVGNGWLDFLPSVNTGTIVVGDGASLLTDGTIAFAAPGSLDLGDVNLGARYLTVAQDQIDIGTADSLAAAGAAGALQPGWHLTQDVLDRLLRPAPDTGVPALERLTLTAGGAFNFYGSATLDTGDSPVRMVFETPAFYGWGDDADVVRIATRDFLWGGISTGAGTSASPYASQAPATVRPGGPGTGTGRLEIDADTVTFGYDDLSQPQSQAALDRLALGFAGVQIRAADRVTANHLGTLTAGGTQAGDGSRSGGDLAIATPLLTGLGGSAMTYTAGGALTVTAPDGAASADIRTVDELGASITLAGQSVSLDTAVALPSGKLAVQADGDVALGDGAQLDLAGRAIAFFDVTKYSWGGDVSLASGHGNIAQATGSRIDVSAGGNAGGSLQVNAPEGAITLGGTLLADGGDGYDDGRFGMTTRMIDAAGFTALNGRLDAAGFHGARSFDVKQGGLTVAGPVTARQVSLTADAGSITIDGVIDASGNTPGNIVLSARDDVVLTGNAVLDAHGNALAVDSYGAPIDASNRGRIVLVSKGGTVRLASGATLDLTTPDGVARGQIDINAPRLTEAGGDIAIDAAGPLTVRGAASIAVDGFWTYSPTDADGTVTQDNGDAAGSPVGADGVVGLKQIDARNTQFIDAAWSNVSLQGRLAGLKAYGDAFHLRPGVEIASTGDLTTRGDLDLSGYRYGPGADPALRGSGEPGVLVLRAGGDLHVNGSVNDGFGQPVDSPDGTILGVIMANQTLATAYAATGGEILASGTQLPTSAELGFDLPLSGVARLYPRTDVPLPFDVTLGGANLVNKNASTNPNQVLGGDIILPNGTVYPKGTPLSAITGTTLPSGTIVKAGNLQIGQPAAGLSVQAMTIPRGTPVALLARPATASYALTAAVSLQAGDAIPAGTTVTNLSGIVGSRPIWAIAPMLAPGMQSWSMRLVAGADLTSADTRAVRAAASAGGSGGDLVLNDPFQVNTSTHGLGTPDTGVSVLRTGTGDLELYAAGDYTQLSPYGVYTAGTAVDGTGAGTAWNAPREVQDDGTLLSGKVPSREGYEATLGQRIWYPTGGGDFTLAVGGGITGYQDPNAEMVGSWLLRQGGAELGQATAWGINFGTYVLDGTAKLSGGAAVGLASYAGLGALGGGNVVVRAGGDIGVDDGNTQGNIVVAVGGSGRVIGGEVVQTGGGSLSVTAGGRIYGGQYDDLRGDTTLRAAAVGVVQLTDYGVAEQQDPRGLDVNTAYAAASRAGASFAPGDGTVGVQTLGDLAMGNVIDPGRSESRLDTAAAVGGASGSTATWFTLWSDATALDLFSAGGNAAPMGGLPGASVQSVTAFLPSVLSVTAPGGSIYYAPGGDGAYLLPSPNGHLDLLARDRVSGVSANSYQNLSLPFGPLGVAAGAIATPLAPAWRMVAPGDFDSATVLASNYWSANAGSGSDSTTNMVVYSTFYESGPGRYRGQGGTPFMFGPETLSDGSMEGDGVVSHIYAVTGDLQNVQIGGSRDVRDPNTNAVTGTYYWASKPVRMLAGGDIIDGGGLFAHGSADDVSMVAAQGDMFFVTSKGFSVVGPGTLEVSAGGDVYLGHAATFASLGPVVPGDARPGASIAVQAGLGAGAPGEGATAYTDFARLYLDSAKLADPDLPLAGQPGKVAKTYDAELRQWLVDRYGYAGGDSADLLAYFLALPAEQQRIFVREVYYAELLASGREYNDPDSKRFGSYLRGRDAIAALFPATDAQGNAIERDGDLTLFQGTQANGGIRTLQGGDIQTLTPGGQTIVGVEGVTPVSGTDPYTGRTQSPAGLLTQGAGGIRMYSEGSVLLGLSRIMTTFGGGIQVWSAEGDINAGRGAKTSLVYTPPRVTYDDLGNVALSPQVPSTGAGIATLNPIPEVPPGDVDLTAPMGTVDAGEAGIRVSGNVNIAALQVVNAANIQVQGKSTGLPVVAMVNVAALTSASAAASQATVAAQDVVRQERAAARQALPSIFTVRVLGFGNDAAPPAPTPAAGRDPSAYRPDGLVKVVDKSTLTPEERRQLGL